jgi:hypothetical protein
MMLVDRMARSFTILGAAVDLPEWETPLTQREYIDVLAMMNRGR